MSDGMKSKPFYLHVIAEFAHKILAVFEWVAVVFPNAFQLIDTEKDIGAVLDGPLLPPPHQRFPEFFGHG